jgi:hypothetical protein
MGILDEVRRQAGSVASRLEQGLPAHVEDRAALARITDTLARQQARSVMTGVVRTKS